ncbi:MAG: DUF6629 family protein [Flavobacteriia bacterium]
MCFSATASFTSSAILCGAGFVAYGQVKSLNHLPFALIPFFFSAQQFAEGLVWMSFNYHGLFHWRMPAAYFYLLTAQFFWPIFFPFSIWKMEDPGRRKKILFALLLIGIIIGIYLGYRVSSLPFLIIESKRHLVYVTAPNNSWFFKNVSLYAIATLIPPFVSSLRGMPAFGSFIVTSLALSMLFFPESVISIWCYFAAILSLIVILILRKPVVDS